MYRSIRKSTTTLLLGLILALPSLALAGHLHEVIDDEINCELCSSFSPAVTTDERGQTTGCINHPQESDKPVRFPFEVFRLNEYQRGPPLLH